MLVNQISLIIGFNGGAVDSVWCASLARVIKAHKHTARLTMLCVLVLLWALLCVYGPCCAFTALCVYATVRICVCCVGICGMRVAVRAHIPKTMNMIFNTLCKGKLSDL